MAEPVREVEAELEQRIGVLGFELVQAVWAGSARRPILRIRIEVPEGSERELAGERVTVDDCAVVSRGLEAWLDEHGAMPEKYVLEVSSPGVERPLTRRRDFVRFAGEEVAVKGDEVLVGRATRLEGTLLGLAEAPDRGEMVRLRLKGGDEIEVPFEEITGAHIVYRWQ